MKILNLKLQIPLPVWGSEISNSLRLEELQRRGQEVQMHIFKHLKSFDAATELFSKQKYNVQAFLHFYSDGGGTLDDQILTLLETEKPDEIWINVRDLTLQRLNLENIILVMSEAEVLWSGKHKRIIVPSRWLASTLPVSKEIRVMPNPVLPIEIDNREKNLLVFINPVKEKGLAFMIQLAKQMPDESFLFVENWLGAPKPAPLPSNVFLKSRVDNLKEIFRETKAVLCPSLCAESFCRVAMEAMSAGIPVIGSKRGALIETIGSGGKTLPFNLETWQKVLQDPVFINRSEKPLERFRQHQEATQKAFDTFYPTISSYE